MIRNGIGRLKIAVIVLLAAAMVAPARADDICGGTLSGSVLQQLPHPTTISLVQPVRDDANPGLTQQFLNGVQAGGVTVLPSGQGSTQLDMTFTVDAGAGPTSGTFKGFGWMSGEQAPGGSNGALAGSVVSVSIEATDVGSQSLAWIGTIKCTIHSSAPGVVSEHLGELVARALGRSVEQQSF